MSSKLENMLAGYGHKNDPAGFFSELLILLGKAEGTEKITINGIELPHLMLMTVMEVVLPGDKLISVKNVDELEKAANLKVVDTDRTNMQKVIDT